MGPNIEVISYRFKTASAITGFQQPLHHREWEYFQPLSAHGLCSCVISWGWLGRARGLCWDCPGSTESMAFVFRRAWIPQEAELGIFPAACTPAHPSVPAPAHLAVTHPAAGRVLSPSQPSPFGDSLIFHGRDHQYQNLDDGRRRLVNMWIYR